MAGGSSAGRVRKGPESNHACPRGKGKVKARVWVWSVRWEWRPALLVRTEEDE